ncbi:MAG: CRISPR-associated endonuclease Cas1 [Thaumarchaeota archaeon]|nr:CRISPR-associated endonuclease Cas1 [Nitrososphaerota archaeon]
MTLKGQKNHYNVKLLRGYGVSINIKNNKIILKNGSHDITGESEKEEWFVTKIPYEKIVISGKGYVSTEAISLLSKKNINVLLTDTYGNPISYMNNVMSSNTSTRYRMGQYQTFSDPVKREYLQKWILSEKLQSQINFLKSIEQDDVLEGIKRLQKYKDTIFNVKEYQELLSLETKSGRIYFLNYTKLIPSKYNFDSRRGGGLAMRKNNAGDIINALLNYGYTVLAGEISKYVNGLGLDAYYGFYHKSHVSFQALVYDLIEPFRWLVEYSVYKLANDHNKTQMIKKREYTWTREGKIVIDSDLIRRFLEILERKFQSERPYKFKYGIKTKNGMSKCQEITIAKINVQNLADHCMSKLFQTT